MASAANKSQVLSLYKLLMREAQKFDNYNFKFYALRRIKDGFKDNKTLTDVKVVKKELHFARDNLDIIRRQVSIGQMYKVDKLVIEN